MAMGPGVSAVGSGTGLGAIAFVFFAVATKQKKWKNCVENGKLKIENWVVILKSVKFVRFYFEKFDLKNLKYFSEVEKTLKFYNKKIEVLILFLPARNNFIWFQKQLPTKKKCLPIGVGSSDHVSGLVMAQIASRGLISWLVSLGLLYPDPSAFQLIAIQVLNSLISILVAVVVDEGETSRFPKN